MSRSYRKPYNVEGPRNGKTKEKRFASKKVRKSEYISDGASYKKMYCSYNICDYRIHQPDNKKLSRK